MERKESPYRRRGDFLFLISKEGMGKRTSHSEGKKGKKEELCFPLAKRANNKKGKSLYNGRKRQKSGSFSLLPRRSPLHVALIERRKGETVRLYLERKEMLSTETRARAFPPLVRRKKRETHVPDCCSRKEKCRLSWRGSPTRGISLIFHKRMGWGEGGGEFLKPMSRGKGCA